jgi:rhodanese-related sulfurtransferase
MRGAWACAALAALVVAALSGGCTGGEERSMVVGLSVEEAHALIETRGDDPSFVILDVRTRDEYVAGHIEGAINLDYYDPSFAAAVGALDPGDTYLVYCRSGVRSAAAIDIMVKKGFSDLYNLEGGTVAWTAAGYPLA